MLVVSAPRITARFLGHSASRVSDTTASVVTTAVATVAMEDGSLGKLRHLPTGSMAVFTFPALFLSLFISFYFSFGWVTVDACVSGLFC